ncbi:hypothetical protein KQI84_16900 [bacterium]|nr:hypothetical protein [bacterium]
MIPSQVIKGMDDQPAQLSGGRNGAGASILQYDLLVADLNGSGSAIGEEDDLRWDLIGETEQVRGVSACWL